MTDDPKHIVWIELATRGDTDDVTEAGIAVTNGGLDVVAEAPGLTGTVADIEAAALAMLGEHVATGAAPLGSSSAQRVRHLLRAHMPGLHDFLHYRSVDLTTLRELARRWYPHAPPPPAAGTVHASIDELRYYRANLFK